MGIRSARARWLVTPLRPRFRALAVALLLVAAPARADTARVSLEVDKHITTIGDPIQVTVTIEIEGRSGYSRYIPPAFNDFRVSGGGMTTQNIQMINWKVRRTESYSYSVSPLREGLLSLGPAAIVFDGRMLKSSTATIKVRKGSAPVPDPVQPTPDPTLDPGNRDLPSVFLVAAAAPTKVYLGQQVVVTWSLFTQSDVLGFQTTKQPVTDGFWSEDLRSPHRLEFERKMLGARAYYAATLLRKALFPQRAGKLTIGQLEASVRTLDSFTSSSSVKQSDPVTVEVLPLPDQGKPAGFHEGNVGSFDGIVASLDRTSVKAGDAVTLKIVVRGVGNLSQLKLPPLTGLDASFRVYEPKVSDRLELEGRVSGEKIVEYLLMPTRGGLITIPPIHLDTFNPETARYQRVSTAALSLTVSGSLPAGQDLPLRPDAKANVLGPNIRPPRPAAGLSPGAPTPLHRSLVGWTLFVLPLLLTIAVVGGDRLRERLARETPRSIRRVAAKRVRAHLARAQQLRAAGDTSGFFGEVAAAIRCQLDHRLALRSEGLTREELAARMGEAGYPGTLAEEVLGELDNCDFARFAPAASGGQQMAETIQRARRLVERLGHAPVRRGGAGATAALVICGLALCSGPARAETLDQAHARALRDYYAGRYGPAVDGLERLLGLRVESPKIHYNLGCAYYRLGKLGPAVFHFERALRLDGSDEDARFNLETVRAQLATQVKDEIKGASVDPWWVRLVSTLGERTVVILFLGLWWAALGAALALRFMAPGPGRAALFVGECFLGVCTALAALLLAGRIYLAERVTTAIVLPDRVEVREGPDSAAKSSFSVHAGLRVRLQAHDGGWSRVRLANGLEGWVPVRDLGTL
jgi:tetratricopeptide (TPR) repeat protein